MESQNSKKNGTVKEEGELTDDEDDDGDIRNGSFDRKSWNAFDGGGNREVFRYSSVDKNKNYEVEDRFGSRRKDFRRRVETDSRRSFRTASDGGFRKHHREYQDFKQTSASEIYTPSKSKLWANRRFRASSMRPPSVPRHTKPLVLKRIDSPQQHKYQGVDGRTEGQDELERLQREHERIREQLKSLEEEEEEEEEQNDESSEKNSVLESLEARSEAGEELTAAFSGTNDGGVLNYMLEAEKSDNEDIDVQKLRRLALATSERHIRLMEKELQTSQPGAPSDDVVVIPDVEPDLPEPEVFTVEEEEEENMVEKRLEETVAAGEAESKIPSSKRKKKRKKGLAKMGPSSVKRKLDVEDAEKKTVKSKIIQPSPKKAKVKKHKKEDTKQAAAKWAQERRELRVLVMHNPKEALEKLLQYASEWEGKEKPIVTGTIKDLKRQRQIPVLSDKVAVQSFSQKSANKKNLPQEKSKEAKEQSRKSGQLQDNYDEVEMDIDSNAEDGEEGSSVSGVELCEDFSWTTAPVSSFSHNLDRQDFLQNLQQSMPTPGAAMVFSHHLSGQSSAISCDGVLFPSLPPPPPPPLPPPHPSAFEQDFSRRDQRILVKERNAAVTNSGIVVSTGEPRENTYQEDTKCVYPGPQRSNTSLAAAAAAAVSSVSDVYNSKASTGDFREVEMPPQSSSDSFDEYIGRQLRLLRHSQDKNPASGSPEGKKVQSLGKPHPGTPVQRFVFDECDRTTSQHLRSLVDYSSVEDPRASDQVAECVPSMDVRRTAQSQHDVGERFLNHSRAELSSSIQRDYSKMVRKHSAYDFLSEIDAYMGLSQRQNRSLTNSKDERIFVTLSNEPSPSTRAFIEEDERLPSPPRQICRVENLRRGFRDGPGSYSSPYSRRPLERDPSGIMEVSYSPLHQLTSREHCPEKSHVSPRSMFPWQRDLVNSQKKTISPQDEVHRGRSSSSERVSAYQPELSPSKKVRYSSPPPYIPTAILRPATNREELSGLDHHQNSDSEEEDPTALRMKLLRDVIEKRKATGEAPSDATTPSVMSPRQDSTHSESSEAFVTKDISNSRFQASNRVLEVSEDEEEDIRPPPVINRCSRRIDKPQSLAELCKTQISQVTYHDYQQRPAEHEEGVQYGHEKQQAHVEPNHFKMGSVFEEDNEGLSEMDREALRAYVIKVQKLAPTRTYSRVAEDTACHDVSGLPVQDETPWGDLIPSNSDTVFPASLSERVAYSEDQSLPLENSLQNPPFKSSASPALGNLITVVSVDASEPSNTLGQTTVPNSELASCDMPTKVRTSTSEPRISSSHLKKKMEQFDVFKSVSENKPQAASSGSSVSSKKLETVATQSSLLKKSATLLAGSPSGFDHVDGLSATANSNKDLQHKNSLGPASTLSLSAADTANLNVNTVVNHSAVSQSSTVKAADLHAWPTITSASSKVLSSFNDRPSLSLYSKQHYNSGASGGPRKYSNVHTLPVHPQVVVPVNSLSDSDDDDSDEQTSQSAVSSGVRDREEEQVAQSVFNAQGVMPEGQGSETSSQFLRKQEELLGSYEQSIQKDQKMVKLLVKRVVKFLEAQQVEQQKLNVIRSQLVALSQKMKTTDKLVTLFKVEKEKTEKQVQLITERLLRNKKIYTKKMKSVLSLGAKIMGSSYVPTIVKPLQEAASRERHNSDRAHRIAQEKLKLMEKEKQIAEKLRTLKEAMVEKEAGKHPAAEPVLDVSKNSASKWKSQDVIRIDKDANPDISVKQRRKSLLEMNPSTTPNIPLTPRRSISVSNVEKENVATETSALDVKPGDKELNGDLSSSFRMPSGTQLSNFCKLQREKTHRYLRGPHSLPGAGAYAYPSLIGIQTLVSQIRLKSSEKHGHCQDDVQFLRTSLKYSSPLLMFRSYRFNSYFRTKENLCLQSRTYSHKINPNSVLCPYDLRGTCNDDSCQQLHPKDYKFSDHELLEDIVSYCPKMAGAPDGASPEEVKKCIVNYVDNILSKHRGKMTIDDLCLWLSSQVNEACGKRHPHAVSLEPRVWKPHPKDETGLSLDLDQKLTNRGVEAISVDKKVIDKDTVINEEDVRYFADDGTEMLSLEVSTMQDQTNIQLWQKLASKKLSDPNKSPKECLDQALNVLARGLEANRNNSDLWFSYLSLYRKHSEVKDFPEFCQTALEYAPSYDLWFLYLDSLNSYTEKDEVSTQVLEFLYSFSEAKDVPREARTNNGSTVSETSSEKNPESIATLELVSDVEAKEETVKLNDIQDSAHLKSTKEFTQSDPVVKMEDACDLEGDDTENAPREPETKHSSVNKRKLSHQTLEMVLYKTSLNLLTGRIKSALHFLQVVLRLKTATSFAQNLADLLTSSDLLVLWLTYIHVLEWHQLPPQLYSMANQNPGRIMAKNNIALSWSKEVPPHTGVDILLKLHDRASKVWKNSEKDEETVSLYVKLVQSHVALLVAQGRQEEAIAKCRSVLSDWALIDVWLTLADLYASCHDQDGVKQVFNEALTANKYSSKLQFYQNMFLYQKGEVDLAIWNLEQFARFHFDADSQVTHQCSLGLLYSQLLRQEEAFSLHTARFKQDVPDNLNKDIFMWLCYSLLMEMKGETSETVEIFERSLTHVQAPGDLILIWQNYIPYMLMSRTPPKDARETIIRSIVSVPTKFPIPFSPHPVAMWLDYHYSNRLVEAWVEVLSPEDALDLMEMCLGFMPNNIEFLLRALDLCLKLKENRRGYSWCRFVAAQADRPANLAFWKMAIALAQVEGTPREVERMLIGCVETMPLAVSGWKDFLLYEVSRDNLAAVQKLLACCQQLGLNIQGFVSTLSAT